MIVFGADTHKRSHTIAAVAAASGELLGEQTVPRARRAARNCCAGRVAGRRAGLGDRGLPACLGLAGAVSDRATAKRVLRVHSTLMSASRRQARGRGNVRQHRRARRRPGRIARRPGRRWPAAHLDGLELDLRLLVEHRERLVRQRVAINNTLQWHLHDLWPDLRFPGSALFHGIGRASAAGSPGLSRRCASGSRATSCAASASCTQTIKALEAEIADLVVQIAPQRLDRARLRPAHRGQARRRESRDAQRFASDAESPEQTGSPPSRSAPGTPASAIGSTAAATARSTPRSTASRVDPPAPPPETKDYVARKRTEGKSTKDASCLKRHLTRAHLAPAPDPDTHPGSDAHTLNRLT